ncbi:hypothetical protein CDD83_6628 [Cordyceps sp. RAO-2017]|nr:hypothetical protein CDD83_6628 [Cordyceps sp. RAO-2017]
MYAESDDEYMQLTIESRHYSYECKASSQERPYVSRPSRSQQLRNPKLVPKLTNNALEPLEAKKGVADAEIAKRQAERTRKRDLEDREDKAELPPKQTTKEPDQVSDTGKAQAQPRICAQHRETTTTWSQLQSRLQSTQRRETTMAWSQLQSRL